ncbi:MAG: insulinase family protein [Candidatus Riflebacteria bacterium]|nr:insulinase family protein [Candidatus Riflebacteria bacterium]
MTFVFHPISGPAVGLALLVRCGSVWETLPRLGISHFLEHMLFRGVPKYPSITALGLALDDVGAESNAATYSDMTILSMKTLPETLESGLSLLYSMATEPVLEGLTAEKKIILEECMEDTDEDGQVVAIDQLSSQLLYGNHVYSYPILGTPQTVEHIDRRALREHLKKHYKPSGVVLAIAGDISLAKARKFVQRVFGSWNDPDDSIQDDQILPVPPFRGPRVLRVVSARSQVSVRISFRALNFCDPDYYVEKTILRILDATSGSPLRRALQDENGFCYSLSAGVDAYEHAGAVHVDLNLQPDRLIKGIGEVLRIFSLLARKGFTKEETERSTAQYVKGKRLSSTDPWDFSGRVAFRALFPTPLSFEQEFAATQNLIAEDLNRVAARLFRTENLGITLVGPVSDRLLRDLRALMRTFSE